MKYLNYFLIIVGALFSLYSKVNSNPFYLISGIVVLMFGVYRLSKTIPSNSEAKNNHIEDE